jgi:acetyltransferase-like isoleucine patch superfamily enzyme
LNNPILFQPRESDSLIRIGERTAVVNGCEMIARTQIVIGADCRIGPRCSFIDADFHGIKPNERSTLGVTKPIVVEDNVWFGAEVMVLKGSHIGKDAVIGARTVVSKDVSAGDIIVGSPMKIIGSAYA